jgi:hypothetical protein
VAAGLPGTGIGGLFYLLLGALLPIRNGARALRGKAVPSLRSTVRMLALLGGILTAIWVQAWLLGVVIHAIRPTADVEAAVDRVGGSTATSYVRWAGLAGVAGLLLVFLGVHGLRLVVRRVRTAPRPTIAQVPAPVPYRRLAS